MEAQNRQKFLQLIEKWKGMDSNQLEAMRNEASQHQARPKAQKKLSEQEIRQNAQNAGLSGSDLENQVKVILEQQKGELPKEGPIDIDKEFIDAATPYFNQRDPAPEKLEVALQIANGMQSFYAAYDSTHHPQHKQYQLIPNVIELLDKSIDNTQQLDYKTYIQLSQLVQNMFFVAAVGNLSEEEQKTSEARKALSEKIPQKFPSCEVLKIKNNVLQHNQDDNLSALFNELDKYVKQEQKIDDYTEELPDIARIITAAIDKYLKYVEADQKMKLGRAEDFSKPMAAARKGGYKHLQTLIAIFEKSLNVHGHKLEPGNDLANEAESVVECIQKIKAIEKHKDEGEKLEEKFREKAPIAYHIFIDFKELEKQFNQKGTLHRISFENIMNALDAVLDHKNGKTEEDYSSIIEIAQYCANKSGSSLNGLTTEDVNRLTNFAQKCQNNEHIKQKNQDALKQFKFAILNECYTNVQKEIGSNNLGEYTNAFLNSLTAFKVFPHHQQIAQLAFTAAQHSTDKERTKRIFALFKQTLEKCGNTLEQGGQAASVLDKVQEAIDAIKGNTQYKATGNELEEILKEKTPVRFSQEQIKSPAGMTPPAGKIKEPDQKQPFPKKALACGINGALAGGVAFTAPKLTGTLEGMSKGSQIGIGIACVLGGVAALLAIYAVANKVSTCLSDAKAQDHTKVAQV